MEKVDTARRSVICQKKQVAFTFTPVAMSCCFMTYCQTVLCLQDLLGQETPEATWLLVRGQLLEVHTPSWQNVASSALFDARC